MDTSPLPSIVQKMMPKHPGHEHHHVATLTPFCTIVYLVTSELQYQVPTHTFPPPSLTLHYCHNMSPG